MKKSARSKAKKRVSAVAAAFRARRHCRDLDQMIIKRSNSPWGPYLVLDLRKGKVIAKRIPSLAALAVQRGLLRADEVLA